MDRIQRLAKGWSQPLAEDSARDNGLPNPVDVRHIGGTQPLRLFDKEINDFGVDLDLDHAAALAPAFPVAALALRTGPGPMCSRTRTRFPRNRLIPRPEG